ncbi:MAG: Mce-associated rane protein [Mycobacterium sp.]|nr:Mce-associated rane protein [Mycobacterium sp.]
MTNTPEPATPDEESTALDEVDLAKESEATEATAAGATATGDEAEAEGEEPTDVPAFTEAATARKGTDKGRLVAFAVLPALALVLALVGGWLKFVDSSASDADNARTQSVQAAKDSTIALLSYQPNTVEQQLTDARKLLTGEFLTSYTSLTDTVVIPGAKEKQISAVAAVPASASVSADQEHAVVLVFVNQTVVVGQDAPTATASSVRLTMDKVDGKWLISKFEPV